VARRIILVDSDQAFATILKEGLEATGDYEVTLVGGGNEALESIGSDAFDMAMGDVWLEGIKPHALVRDIRGGSACVRIMLIPLAGHEVPDELNGIEIQSLLPKPFFVDDL
jgi:DNA-binding response OmpR family regulator